MLTSAAQPAIIIIAMSSQRQDFRSLDRLPHLRVRTDKHGHRRQSSARQDAVSQHFANCKTASAMARLAHTCGLSKAEIVRLARSASSLGSWSMVLRNRVRGTLNNIMRARTKGITLSPERAAGLTRKQSRQLLAGSKRLGKK